MTKLREMFLLFNDRYFRGSLPKDCWVIWDDMQDMGDYSRVGVDGAEHLIRINRNISRWRRTWAMTLLHEMVHLKLLGKSGCDGHGYRFQREMKRLANAGAFKGLW